MINAQNDSLQFDYPVNGQTLDLEGSYLFKLKDARPEQAYRWQFRQNNVLLWDSFADEHVLSTGSYGIADNSLVHQKFGRGEVLVTVSEWFNGTWDSSTTITIILKPRAAVEQPTVIPIAPSIPADRWHILARIVQGQPFEVKFDATARKFDDSHYTGNVQTDPLGNLKGGEVYKITYRPATNEWVTTGMNQEVNQTVTAVFSNANPTDHELSLWGRVFLFSSRGEVFDADYGLVGHISFLP